MSSACEAGDGDLSVGVAGAVGERGTGAVAGDDVTKTKNKKPKNGIKKVFQKLKEKVSSSLPS